MGFQLCNEIQAENLTMQNLDNSVAQIKYDGMRAQIKKQIDTLNITGRENPVEDWKFPEINSLKKEKHDFLIDGEIIIVDHQGNSDFGLLLSRAKTRDGFKLRLMAKKYPVTYVVFDILELDGKDLRSKPYLERHRILTETIKDIPHIMVAEIYTDPIKLYKRMVEEKQEGIILKNAHGEYQECRNDNWIKVKRKEYVIVKFTQYYSNNKGITLENEQGTRVACLGAQSSMVRDKIDKEGFANVEIARLGGRTVSGKHRQITFSRLVGED